MSKFLIKLKELRLPEPIAVVGMGVSGRAAFEYLRAAGYLVQAFDARVEDGINFLDLHDKAFFEGYATLVLSPGIDRRALAVCASQALKINDVEIFARLLDRPVYAVTGSNGKSTVVSMLAHIFTKLGKKVSLCGNIGRPVLSALFEDEDSEAFVMELSSYQLEVCPSLRPKVGALMNITPDHLDRYDSFMDYAQAKANLVRQSDFVLLNKGDALCVEFASLAKHAIFYGAGSDNFVQEEGLVLDGRCLLSWQDFPLRGKHNYENALLSVLMAQYAGLDIRESALALRDFKGLNHRMVLLRTWQGVDWIDDSKATNIGATAAALEGLDMPVVLIAGGVAKGQDFSLLAEVVKRHSLRALLLIGEDNHTMENAFKKADVDFVVCHTMARAVSYAKEVACEGDCVLLSPATASFDQYKGYAARGDDFAKWVLAL